MEKTSRPSGTEGRVRWRLNKRSVAATLGVVMLIATVMLSLWQPPRANPFLPTRILSADWWLHPMETNAFLRLAALDASLNAVHVASDGRRVWAAGTAA
jgi:hypothetical protein